MHAHNPRQRVHQLVRRRTRHGRTHGRQHRLHQQPQQRPVRPAHPAVLAAEGHAQRAARQHQQRVGQQLQGHQVDAPLVVRPPPAPDAAGPPSLLPCSQIRWQRRLLALLRRRCRAAKRRADEEDAEVAQRAQHLAHVARLHQQSLSVHPARARGVPMRCAELQDLALQLHVGPVGGRLRAAEVGAGRHLLQHVVSPAAQRRQRLPDGQLLRPVEVREVPRQVESVAEGFSRQQQEALLR
ncbi:uncharacterized protein BcabD6B2_40660 [Babesia caballi]|uniref:Uncharacterized protein n=1 Tax=Babesia caballi TaxID=5871 RepID=A0AAV4LZS8_BABCB|nr:hypothetical protein BcabD6B2_40660 [Babesia caballi]